MNAEYRVCERCHGTGGSWEINLAQHLRDVWVRCPGCGGSRWVVVRPAEALTPEQQADIEKMLSTLDTPNTQGNPAEPTPDTPNTQGDPAEPAPDYYEAEQWEERQAEADAHRDKSAQGSVVAIVPHPNRKRRFPMSRVLARGVGVLAMAALIGLAGFLWVQLDRAESLRAEVEADLQKTVGELDQQAAANFALELSLAEFKANVDAQAAVISGLRADIGELLAEQEHIEAKNDRLEVSLAAAHSESDGLQRDLNEAAREAEEQQQQYHELNGLYEDHQQAAGTLDNLRAEAFTLRDDIADLEERRKPLILTRENAPTEGFLCTGSMEPVITCLDEAVWLEDFRPEDVVVGAVIAYDPPPGCKAFVGTGTAISHRVAAIRVSSNGTYEFWPQGDASDEPDGCWVPHTSVTGYIIELQRGVVPQNAARRDRVNGAKAAQDAAELVYLDLIERHCGHRNPARCTVPYEHYPQVATAYNEYIKAHYQWECVLRSARSPGNPQPCRYPPIIPTHPYG